MVNVLSRLALVATIATSAVNAVPTNNALYEDLCKLQTPFIKLLADLPKPLEAKPSVMLHLI
jgi:hypothetical protein